MHPLSGASRGVVALERRRALVALIRGVVALGGLQGCGGGSGSSASPSPGPVPSPPSPPPGPIAAQMSVPTPVGYDADRLAAFDRLNEIRLSAGLGMLAQSGLLDQAAQAHAAWIMANDALTHVETLGSVGFTGANWWDRDEVMGYVPVEGEEVIAAPVRGAEGVDGLVNTLYHRAGMLAFEPVDVGIGWASATAAGVSMPLVIDMTRPGTDPDRAVGQAAQARIDGACVWPVDGARDVPLRLGTESPNPVPAQDVMTLGTPVSVTVDEESTIAVDSFVLTNIATGAVVAARLLTNASDPNQLLPRSFAALVPLDALLPGGTYQAALSGSIVGFLSGSQRSLQRAWSFTTARA